MQNVTDEPKKRKQTIKALKHYLRSVWYYQKKKNILSDKIMVLRSRAEKITTSYQDAPTFGGYEDHRQAVIEEMVDKQAEYKELVEFCKIKEQEVQFFIDCLDGYENDFQERIVLEYRYIYFENWQDIALRLNYSEPMIYKIHGSALLHLLEVHKKMMENGKRLF